MKNAIILHGQPSKEEYYDFKKPSMSNAHWLPWLQGQLLKYSVAAATPEVPFSYEPNWDLWVKEVERHEINPETIIVGHSCGGDFWLKYLSEHADLKVGKVVLIAPSLGYLTEDDNFFGDFKIDPDLVARTHGITLFHSDNDGDNMLKSAEEIIRIIKNLKNREFHLGHFTSGSMKTLEFPELLKECLS
jgi:predicted alpha/beta hydrolase family esterase